MFCSHFAHLLSKQRRLPVESSKAPGAARACRSNFAPDSVQPDSCRSLAVPTISLVLARAGHKAQKRCRLPFRLCELWRFGPVPEETSLTQGTARVADSLGQLLASSSWLQVPFAPGYWPLPKAPAGFNSPPEQRLQPAPTAAGRWPRASGSSRAGPGTPWDPAVQKPVRKCAGCRWFRDQAPS